MYLTNEIVAKLESLGISPKKSLGQNFLVSRNTIHKIVAAAKSLKPQALIEVGPGLGSLTEELLKSEVPITLIELDRVFAQYWRDRKARAPQIETNYETISHEGERDSADFLHIDSCKTTTSNIESSGLEVIEVDALKWDWNRVLLPAQTVLVSNLPYQISSSLVIDRSIAAHPLQGMVLMFQKEVAERIVAKPKTEQYGLLSVIAQNFWTVEFVTDAGPKDFYPPPRVASRVLKFTPRGDFQGRSKDFLTLVKAGFLHRRKYLISNLKSLGYPGGAEFLKEMFDALKLSHQARAEELGLNEWRALFHQLRPNG